MNKNLSKILRISSGWFLSGVFVTKRKIILIEAAVAQWEELIKQQSFIPWLKYQSILSFSSDSSNLRGNELLEEAIWSEEERGYRPRPRPLNGTNVVLLFFNLSVCLTVDRDSIHINCRVFKLYCFARYIKLLDSRISRTWTFLNLCWQSAS